MLASQKCEGSRGSLWVVTFEYHLPFFLCLFLEMCCPWTVHGEGNAPSHCRHQKPELLAIHPCRCSRFHG